MSEKIGRTLGKMSPREIAIEELWDEWTELEVDRVSYRERAYWRPHPENQAWLDAAEIVAHTQKVILDDINRLEKTTDDEFELEALNCT